MSHQSDARPMLNATQVCSFASVRIYEVCTDPYGAFYLHPLLALRTEPYALVVKPAIQVQAA